MTYRVADDDMVNSPTRIFARVLATFPELEELRALVHDHDMTVAILMKEGELKLRSQLVAGLAALPDAQGAMKPLFAWLLEDKLGYPPDFLIILSADFWAEASDRDREALVVHEALHCGHAKDAYGSLRFNSSTGSPIIGIMPHDVEEFEAVVRRYGAWTPDLKTFHAALAEGESRTDTDTDKGRD
jgi:hypothetical protein